MHFESTSDTESTSSYKGEMPGVLSALLTSPRGCQRDGFLNLLSTRYADVSYETNNFDLQPDPANGLLQPAPSPRRRLG